MEIEKYLDIECSKCKKETEHEYMPEPVKFKEIQILQYRCLECKGGTCIEKSKSKLEEMAGCE